LVVLKMKQRDRRLVNSSLSARFNSTPGVNCKNSGIIKTFESRHLFSFTIALRLGFINLCYGCLKQVVQGVEHWQFLVILACRFVEFLQERI